MVGKREVASEEGAVEERVVAKAVAWGAALAAEKEAARVVATGEAVVRVAEVVFLVDMVGTAGNPCTRPK